MKTEAKKAILVVDASLSDKVRLVLLTEKKITKHDFISERNLSERLLSEIEIFFKKIKLDLENIVKIAVSAGPGPFSRIRTAVATANALAYSLNIPVITLSNTEIFLDWAALNDYPTGFSATPVYDKQPNIHVV